MKRIICLILCILILTSSLIACKNVGDTAETEESTVEITEKDMSNVCEVPDTDEWKGKEFRTWTNTYTKTDMVSDGLNGEVLNDAIFKRNTMVETKYGIKMTSFEGKNLSSVVAAGEDAFDLYGGRYTAMNEALLNGIPLDIDKLTYMAPEKAWWNTQLIDSFEIGGKKMVFSGDFSQRIMDYTWSIIVNKRMAGELNIADEIYTTVRDGKWTIEKLKQNCINVTTNSNGDEVLDHHDTWGFLSSKNVAVALMMSSDIKTVVKDSKGSLKFNLNNATVLDKLEEIWKFSSDGSFQLKAHNIKTSGNIFTEVVKIFNEGRALYQARVMTDVRTSASKVKDDYALIPLPKYDEEQENYISTFQAHSVACYIVPRTVADTDYVSAVLEYMSYVSTDTIRAAYYDTVLQGRAAKDADSIEMLDMIFETSETDIGLHLGVASMRDFMDKILNSDTNVLSSEIANRTEKVNTELFKYENSVKIWG